MTNTRTNSDEDERKIMDITNKLNRALNGNLYGHVVTALMRLLADGLATAKCSKDKRKVLFESAVADLREYFSAYMAKHDAARFEIN